MRLGSFEVTKYALGTWAIGGGTWWGANDDNECILTIQKAVDAGIKLVDTAPAYGFGHSEEVVGKALKGVREKVRISTKCGLVWDGRKGSDFFDLDGKTVYRNLSKDSVMQECEQSLKRLGTDYIDIYITHWQSIEPCITPIEETMEALLKLKEQGKILSIGVSNVNAEQLETYLKCGEIALVQEKFSILDHEKFDMLEAVCSQHNVVFQAYSPMELGLLTGKLSDDYIAPEGSARSGNKWFCAENIKKVNHMLRIWQPIAQKYGVGVGQLAVAWVGAQAEFVNVLCGARTFSQLEDNLRVTNLEIESKDLEMLTKTADEVRIGTV